jgi:hypothetical protein
LVYFIQDRLSGWIKIGFTMRDSVPRLDNLQVGCPGKLLLIGEHPGDKEYESRLHRRFSPWRARGEWFYPCRALLGFILDHDTDGLVANAVGLEKYLPDQVP